MNAITTPSGHARKPSIISRSDPPNTPPQCGMGDGGRGLRAITVNIMSKRPPHSPEALSKSVMNELALLRSPELGESGLF